MQKRGRRVLAEFEKYPDTFLMMILWEGWVVVKELNFQKVIIIICAIEKEP